MIAKQSQELSNHSVVRSVQRRIRWNILIPKDGTFWCNCRESSDSIVHRKVWTYEKRPDKPYLIANIPGSYVKFYVEVGVMGRVRITYLRSKTFGLGDVWCWIDDDRKGGTKIESWWKLEKLYALFLFADTCVLTGTLQNLGILLGEPVAMLC